jgi:hypothetical protein
VQLARLNAPGALSGGAIDADGGGDVRLQCEVGHGTVARTLVDCRHRLASFPVGGGGGGGGFGGRGGGFGLGMVYRLLPQITCSTIRRIASERGG